MPCLPTQSCRLKCSVVAGTNENGLIFRRNTVEVVACPGGRDSCRSELPALYSHTQVDYSTSFVDIRSFDPSRDATTWSCVDAPNGTVGSLDLVTNTLPAGALTWGSTCVSGRATSPASLSCSLPSPGIPPANLSIVNVQILQYGRLDDNSQDSVNWTAGSSQTGSVTGTVTRGGQASCSVTWSAFPSFPLNISPVLCDVQVAANVTISVQNVTSQSKVITCQAEGHPDTYTFQPWLQFWGRQEVRRVTGSQQGGQYSLTLTSYQDSGTYTCTVDNGVLDSSEEVIQATANINTTIEETPVIPLSLNPPTLYGEIGEPIRLFRTLFSPSNLTHYTWYFNSMDVTTLMPEATTNRTQTMVLLPVYNASVTTEGVVVNLFFTVSPSSLGLYRLAACNSKGCRSTEFELEEAKPPFAPENLHGRPNNESVILSWVPGHPGGDFFQWFHVQYRGQDSQEGQWSDVSTADNRSSSDRTRVMVYVDGLDPDTSYVFRVRAQSSRRLQNLGSFASVTVKTSGGVGLDKAAAVGVAVAVTFVVSVASSALVFYAVKHLRQNAGSKKENVSTRFNNAAFNGEDASGQTIPAPQDDYHTVAADFRKSSGDEAYSVLDPATIEKPRAPPIYQPLATRACLDKTASGPGSKEGAQASAHTPKDDGYTNVLNL